MQDVPSVSIVVPVRDEVSTIAATLDACLAQEYDGDLEVIVALADSSHDMVRRGESALTATEDDTALIVATGCQCIALQVDLRQCCVGVARVSDTHRPGFSLGLLAKAGNVPGQVDQGVLESSVA